jgi:hypothetical protein
MTMVVLLLAGGASAAPQVLDFDKYPSGNWEIWKSGGSSSVSGGILTINSTSYNEFGLSHPFDEWHQKVNNSKGWIIETRLKVDASSKPACSGGGGVLIWIHDHKNLIQIGFSTDEICISYPNSFIFPMDTTDNFHVYRIESKLNQIKVYVDNVLRLDRTLSNTGGGTDTLMFGDGGGSGNSLSYWDYFLYDVNLANITSLPTILSFIPESPVFDVIGATRTFNIKVNQIVNFTWYINGTEVFNQTNVNQSTYTNTSAALGTWNITAIAQNANGTATQTWIWNVTQQIQGNGSISGMKFNDSNGNGEKDPGESGLSNWTIVLKNSIGSIVDTMMTDIKGTYAFGGLAAGNYAVEEVLQADWTQTFPSTRIYNLTLAADENVTGIDFGNNLIPPQASGVNAEREIEKESLIQGESTNITIRINSNIIQALSLKESIPAGWNLTRISDDADGLKNNTNEWVWSNVTPGITKTVIYAIKAPTDATIGTYYINGTISNSSGVIAIVGGNNIITLELMLELDILAYYRGLGSDPDKVETRDLLKAMDDWRSKTVPAGFANPITNQELSALINEWIMS